MPDRRQALATLSALFLAACGGGSDGSSPAPAPSGGTRRPRLRGPTATCRLKPSASRAGGVFWTASRCLATHHLSDPDYHSGRRPVLNLLGGAWLSDGCC
jgi:hypothetical protein